MHGRFVWVFLNTGVIFPFSVQQYPINMDLLTVGIGFIAILVILKLTELYLRTIYLQDLQNKCVLVTGCDSGFSHLLAQELDKRGVRVFAGCLTGDGQTTLTKKCSSNASFFVLTSRKRIRFETLFTWSSRKWQATKAGTGTYCSLDA